MRIRDSLQHQGMRKRLIEELRERNTIDQIVLEAMGKIPRHYFMDSAFLQFAYEDQAFPIGAGQTISQPYTVGFQTTLLEVKPGMRVLEIGTGSGYQTSVLSTLGCKVFSIERQRTLYKQALLILSGMNTTAKLFYGDGFKGLPSFGPFDRILITCGAPYLPTDLVGQLKLGGIMVIPIGAGESQIMHRYVKQADGNMIETRHGDFKFVPMLKDKESHSS